METKLHRIKKVIAWLHSKVIITKQKDIAAAMQMNVSSLSRALERKKRTFRENVRLECVLVISYPIVI